MSHKRIFWQMFLGFTSLTIIALTTVTWYASDLVNSVYLREVSADLKVRAQLIDTEVLNFISIGDYKGLQNKVQSHGEKTGTRITIILPDGKVIADSRENPLLMDNHSDRPEVKSALSDSSGFSVRHSYTLGQDLMYVAISGRYDGKIVGIIRTSVPITIVEHTLNSIRFRIVLAGVIIALIMASLSWIISRRISLPIEELTEGVHRFSMGDFSYRLTESGSRELSLLADALNQMAIQLDEKIKTIERQKNEQQAVLRSMAEGVLAVDRDEKLISINRAAAILLDLPEHDVSGRHIQELIRCTQLHKLISEALATDRVVEDEIVFRSDKNQHVQAYGANLRSEQGETLGALIVLNDVTRLRRLESVRRDFVANVSHEIRTPLTSIKGFVETLRDGAINEPDSAHKFLEIIITQTNRLTAIIDDLLIIASLEQEEARASIRFETDSLLSVINEAIAVCQPAAFEKNMLIEVNCPAELRSHMNAPLIEQALINLISNAIKYSPEKTRVMVKCTQDIQEVVIEVSDEGMGIPREHQNHIFERFYRVDKARSRKMGGTGLGLAIVKHIANVHGGSVQVSSKVGSGSSFFIRIPK